VNCFFYQPAERIPILGPAAILSSEPHSYSRVFTGAFWVTLTGMVVTVNRTPDRATLEQASADAAQLLVAATLVAPVVPAYMSQVAAHFLAADLELFGGKYQAAITNGFVGKGVLAASTVTGGGAAALEMAAAAVARPPRRLDADLPQVTLAGFDFGLGDRPVRVRAAGEAPRLAVAASADDGGPAHAASPEDTARGFLRELFVRNRITIPGTDPGDRLHTHEVVDDGDALRVVRRLVDEAAVNLGS
jgi:hypothetical protein